MKVLLAKATELRKNMSNGDLKIETAVVDGSQGSNRRRSRTVACGFGGGWLPWLRQREEIHARVGIRGRCDPRTLLC